MDRGYSVFTGTILPIFLKDNFTKYKNWEARLLKTCQVLFTPFVVIEKLGMNLTGIICK